MRPAHYADHLPHARGLRDLGQDARHAAGETGDHQLPDPRPLLRRRARNRSPGVSGGQTAQMPSDVGWRGHRQPEKLRAAAPSERGLHAGHRHRSKRQGEESAGGVSVAKVQRARGSPRLRGRHAGFDGATDLVIARASPNTLMEAVVMNVPILITGSLPGQEAEIRR